MVIYCFESTFLTNELDNSMYEHKYQKWSKMMNDIKNKIKIRKSSKDRSIYIPV